ncbi:MAG: cytochrome c-type biogenesis CcmF C-terminal domain-containing protein [Dehalococcoidia bacterium]
MNVLATLGAASLLTALATAAFAAGASVYGLRARSAPLMLAGRRAIVVVALFTTLATAALATALLRDDFSLAYVAAVSSTDMLPHMKWAALYSSQAGSLLFWTWTMSLFLAAFTVLTVPRMPWAAPHATAASGIVLAAFLVALVFLASPFEASEFARPDGVGLNPLLVDKGMLVHPPALLMGLTSTSVPFVLGAAALLSGRIDATWLRAVRHWALLSWLILSVGNILGGWWAYTVLGWGGYWGWDAVENSALLPLLPLTAFLHSSMVQERRGMLKSWNFALVFATFALAVFGTFNVRSGLVASVHSFAQSTVGPYFLVLLAVTLIGSVVLLAWRSPRMRPEHDFDSLVSRETALFLNNYVLTAIALIVLGGTLFPVFSELLKDARITVGPPFYNDIVGPLLIVLVGLIGVGTLLPWRRAATETVVRRARMPLIVTALVTLALALLGMRDRFALAGVAAAVFTGYVTLREFAVGARGARRARGAGGAMSGGGPLAGSLAGALAWAASFGGLFDRDRRRYGGYLVHLGLVVMAVAVIGSNIYQTHVRVTVAPGESFELGRYSVDYDGLVRRAGTSNGIESETVARLRVRQGDDVVANLSPGRRNFINFPGQPMAIVAVDTGWREDVYIFVQGWDDQGVAEFQAFINPLMLWLWVGAAVYTAGGLIAFAPVRAPVRAHRDLPAGAAQQA